MMLLFLALVTAASALSSSSPAPLPPGATRWEDVGVAPALGEALASVGFPGPTSTQSLAIPAIVQGDNDVIIHAPTGSGKTLAYLVPLLALIDAKRHTTQAVVFVPSRELGLQVAAIARKVTTAMYKAKMHEERVMTMSLLSGSKLRRQRAWAWAEPPHLIVGNAKEIEAMIVKKGIKCSDSIQYVVVDEVDSFTSGHTATDVPSDRMALHNLLTDDFGNNNNNNNEAYETTRSGKVDMKSLAAQQESQKNKKSQPRKLKVRRQTVFASATIEQPRQFARKLASLHWCASSETPFYLCEDSNMPATLSHHFVNCTDAKKRLAVARKLIKRLFSEESTGGVMLFVDSSRPVEAIRAALDADARERGSGGVLALDASKDLVSRAKSLNDYVQGNADVLIITDEASRGIDAPRTSHVINLDLPHDARSYAHRAGRTARLGRNGTVLNIILPEQAFVLRRLANSLGIEQLNEYTPPEPAS